MFLKLKQKSNVLSLSDEASDEKLVALYLKTGSREPIAVLFERYTHLVYGICLKYLPDNELCKDAVMDIFESLLQKLTVHDVKNFRNWLYSVTRNHCLMVLRKSGSFERIKDGLLNEQHALLPDAEEDDEEMPVNRQLILTAVDQLNHEQGTCIRLMYLENKSYRDISDITGFSMNEVKSHIQNGKRNLKNFLSKTNGNIAT
ncbi:MAG: sigma-70 family RNA polymerase sigma factor [Bacteroidales bacterium]|nr:sigma-70 family RNA polymerase sigma factor [Bacteroidales bacterium]